MAKIMKEISSISDLKPLMVKDGCKFMALDVGTAKIGVALSCPNFQISLPHSVIIRKNFQTALDAILKVVEESNTPIIIVGLPLMMNGKESDECYNIRKFIEKVTKTIDLPVFFQDERLTTKMANNFLIMSEVSAKKSSKTDDKIAASIILESFLRKTQ